MSKHKIKIKKFLSPVILAAAVLMWVGVILMPQAAWAADICAKDEIVLQVPIPGIPGNGYCVKGFPEYLEAIYNLFVGVSGILAVIMIMFGGFQWLIAGGNSSKISEAKATMLAALAGLTLLLTSYTILNLVNPNLTNLVDLTKKVRHINPQDMGGGYCTKDMKLANNLTGDNAMCGNQYSLLNSPSATCKGVKCEDEDNIDGNIVCFSSIRDYCNNDPELADVAKNGYDPKDIKIRNEQVQISKGVAVCGNIYFWNGLLDKLLYIGSYCGGGQYCVIKESAGYKININKGEIGFTSVDTKVGGYGAAYCY